MPYLVIYPWDEAHLSLELSYYTFQEPAPGWQFRSKKHEKIHKTCRNDLSAFALRNDSEGYKINKPLSGLLVYRRIMRSAERLSSKFRRFPRSFASPPAWFFGQSFSQGHYPPKRQPPKGVYSLHICILHSWIELSGWKRPVPSRFAFSALISFCLFFSVRLVLSTRWGKTA